MRILPLDWCSHKIIGRVPADAGDDSDNNTPADKAQDDEAGTEAKHTEWLLYEETD